MKYSQLFKLFYQAMKVETKKRNFKLSAEGNIYKKVDPYFFSVFHHIAKITEGKIGITLDISVKYHRYDELQQNIIDPGNTIRFTDKIRANSGAKCHVAFPRFVQYFNYDGTEKMLPKLCEDVLDFLKKYYTDFLTMDEKEYGDLGNFYIANQETYPRVAGLACLDKGDFQGAIACFLHPNMDGQHQIWSVEIETDEQRRRAEASGMKILCTSYGEGILRNRKDQFVDYAIALQNGLEWNVERAMYGLLPEERGL